MFVALYTKSDLVNIMVDNFLCCEPDCPQEIRNSLFEKFFKYTDYEITSKFQSKGIDVIRVGCDQFIIDSQNVYKNYGK